MCEFLTSLTIFTWENLSNIYRRCRRTFASVKSRFFVSFARGSLFFLKATISVGSAEQQNVVVTRTRTTNLILLLIVIQQEMSRLDAVACFIHLAYTQQDDGVLISRVRCTLFLSFSLFTLAACLKSHVAASYPALNTGVVNSNRNTLVVRLALFYRFFSLFFPSQS